MAKAWQRGLLMSASAMQARPKDWRKSMSDHIAYALLVYTALQIFVTVGALKGERGSLLPYFALVILVAAIIPAMPRRQTRRYGRAIGAIWAGCGPWPSGCPWR
jgi:hypothetical protein